MNETVEKITTIDGHTIYLHLFSPTAEKPQVSNCNGVILASHGFTEHVNRYHHVAQAACNKNKVFAMFNMRGHGNENLNRGDAENFQCLILDIVSVYFKLKELFEKVPAKSFALFGHSLGGLLTTYAAAIIKQNVTQVFVSAPWYENRVIIPAWKIHTAKYLANYLPRLFIPIDMDINKISNNPEHNKVTSADPILLKKITARFGNAILTGRNEQNISNALSSITAEFTVLLPENDLLINGDYTKNILKQCQCPVNLIELKDAGHESFNELKPIQDTAFSHFEKWLEKI